MTSSNRSLTVLPATLVLMYSHARRAHSNRPPDVRVSFPISFSPTAFWLASSMDAYRRMSFSVGTASSDVSWT
ncbi:hypothetical protein ID866_6688 [Astraeus odoratus]|nr:hypothetical protein ID866_6688 [Astraeus odoratus]